MNKNPSLAQQTRIFLHVLSTIAIEFLIFPIAIKDFLLAFTIDFQKVGINQIDKEEHRKLSGYRWM